MRLDDAYANGAYIAGADAYPPRWAEQAAAFRQQLSREGRAQLDVPYGPSARQVFDMFLPQQAAPLGLFVFVHGGYWLRFDKSYWSHLAAGMLARGWAVAMPSYDLCPDVSIAQITQQIARMLGHVAGQVAGPIALAGHSAGGHLVARMGVPGVLAPGVAGRLAHVMPISPVADLRPLLETSMNAQFRLTDESAAAESPALMRPAPGLACTVWVGADERPAFLDQARWLADAWGAPCHIAPEKHHFDVIDALADPESAMIAQLLA